MKLWWTISFLAACPAVAVVACSDSTCEESATCAAGSATPTNEAGASGDGSTASDANDPNHEGGAADANPCDGGQAFCGGACVDVSTEVKHCGRCDHDCLRGPCINGQCKPYVVAANQNAVLRIGVVGGRVYWVRIGGTTPAGLFSIAEDGSEGTDYKTHYSPPVSQATCRGFALSSTKLFIACQSAAAGAFEIRSCDLPACAVTQSLGSTGSDYVSAIAFDGVTNKLFYAVGTRYQSTGGGIYAFGGGQIGNANQNDPVDLLVKDGNLYWLNAGTFASDKAQPNGGVFSSPIATPSSQFSLAGTNGVFVTNRRLALTLSTIFYQGLIQPSTHAIASAPLGGGAVSAFTPASLDAQDVSADEQNVYFTNPATGTIRYCPQSGCPATVSVLADSQTASTYPALTNDSTTVLWVASDEIRRVTKP